jgi:transposase
VALEELRFIERQMDNLDHEIRSAEPTSGCGTAIGEVPGLGVDSAHQIIAEIGAAAATFESEKHLASCIGVCPGEEESAGVSRLNLNRLNFDD